MPPQQFDIHSLPWLVLIPTCLPILFFFVNLGFKGLFGQKDFSWTGSDMALCGCSAYVSAMLHQIFAGEFRDNDKLGIFLLGFIAAFVFWFVCLKLSSAKTLSLSILSALLGLLVFSLCDWALWIMISV